MYWMFERARNHNIRNRAEEEDFAKDRMLPDVLFAKEISSEKK